MKANKKSIIIFLSGLVLGILLMGAGTMLWNHTQQAASSQQNGVMADASENTGENQTDSEDESDEPADSQTGAESSESGENQDESQSGSEEMTGKEDAESTENAENTTQNPAQDTWGAETVYTGGEEVVYGGKVYRAKWWTQGETPGSAEVWEDMMIAAGQMIEETEESTVVAESRPPRDEVGKRENFKVVGYYPSWKENTDSIQYDVLTHINYAFAIPTAEGGLMPLENAKMAQNIIAEAHKNDVKVFIAVGGWSYHEVPLEPTFVSATETAEKRTALVDAILTMCNEYGFDGVDMDWEHPRVDGGSSKQYEAFMLELAERLHAEGKQLSSAVLSGATADGNIYYDAAAHTDKVLEAVDWINVMAYDGGDGERHSSYNFAVDSGTYWHEMRGLPSEKVVLGVPFYARPSWAAYSSILATVPDAWKTDNTDFNGMSVWYNGISTIQDKTAYALENLGGIMIWEISQDASGEYSLQTAIGKMVKE